MNDFEDIHRAMQAAVDPLTQEQRRMFADELRARFPEIEPIESADSATALECGWQIANSRLLSDPLDPIGEAWARFAAELFAH